jgi:hypothetical protein
MHSNNDIQHHHSQTNIRHRVDTRIEFEGESLERKARKGISRHWGQDIGAASWARIRHSAETIELNKRVAWYLDIGYNHFFLILMSLNMI